jgi:hypothetical protein
MDDGTGAGGGRGGDSGGRRSPVELVAERSRPGELTALWRRLERTGGCRQPIRLRARSRDGGHASAGEPDGVLLVACGSRHVSRCPSCAATYRGDARQLVLAGLCGGKGVPQHVASHPMVFFTLTGPSFGAVHAVRQGPCHLGPPSRCPHGRPRHCLARHDTQDEVVGSPLCPECFDYEACVAFNAAAGELWRRVAIYAFRHLAYTLGTTERELRREVRIAFVKVTEFQRRGAVHLHGVLRADAVGDTVAPAAGITTEVLAEALVRAVQHVRLTRAIGERSVCLAFGEQLRVEPLDAATSPRIASYVANYAESPVMPSRIGEHLL